MCVHEGDAGLGKAFLHQLDELSAQGWIDDRPGHLGPQQKRRAVDHREHRQRAGNRRTDAVVVDGVGAFRIPALQGEQRLVPGEVRMQDGATVVAPQPRLDECLALFGRAQFVVAVCPTMCRVGVVGLELQRPIQHGDSPFGVAQLHQRPAVGREEPPVVLAPRVRHPLQQVDLPGTEVVVAAESVQSIDTQGERDRHRIAWMVHRVRLHGSQCFARVTAEHPEDDLGVTAFALRSVRRQVAATRRRVACPRVVTLARKRPRLRAMTQGEFRVQRERLVDERIATGLQGEHLLDRVVVELDGTRGLRRDGLAVAVVMHERCAWDCGIGGRNYHTPQRRTTT